MATAEATPSVVTADVARPIAAAGVAMPDGPSPPAVGMSLPAGGGDTAVAASRSQPKRSRRVQRWAAAPVLAAAAYVCWVLARQVLWGVREKEPWTLLSVSELAYLVVVAWTMVLVAVTVWTGHRASHVFWPWALVVCAPGLVYLYHFAALNEDWGGSLGADFYEMIALVAALGLLVLVATVGLAARLAPHVSRLLRLLPRLRRKPSAPAA